MGGDALDIRIKRVYDPLDRRAARVPTERVRLVPPAGCQSVTREGVA
jgi:hypothetical protein